MNLVKKNTNLIGAINFLAEFKLYAAFAVLYFTDVSGSMTLGMSVFSVAMLSAAFFELPTGVLSDVIGRRKTLVLGAASAFLSSIFFAIGQQFVFLIAGALLEGLSIAFFSGNNDALLFDLLKQHKQEALYKTYLGKTRSMAHLALSIASILGGVILYLTSYTWIFWLSVIPRLLLLLCSLLIDEPHSEGDQAKASPFKHLKEVFAVVWRNKQLLRLIIADSLSSGAGEASYQFRAAFLRMVWPLWAIGLAGTLGDILATISFWASGKWISKFGCKAIILFGKLYSIVINVVSYLLKSFVSPILLTSNALFYGFTSVAQNDMAQKLYTDRHRASIGSLKSLIGSLMYAFLAVLIGIIADSFGIIIALVSFQAFGVMALIIYFTIFKKTKVR